MVSLWAGALTELDGLIVLTECGLWQSIASTPYNQFTHKTTLSTLPTCRLYANKKRADSFPSALVIGGVVPPYRYEALAS